LLNSGIHLIYVCDSEGHVVWGRIYDPSVSNEVTLADFPQDSFSTNHNLLQHQSLDADITGIMLTERGPMLITSHPIVTSEGKGPSRGSIIMGRFLREKTIQELSDQTHIRFTVRDPKTSELNAREESLFAQLAPDAQETWALDDNTLLGYGVVPDLEGKPALLITTALPRLIVRRGFSTARIVSVVLTIAFLMVGACLFFLLLFTAVRASRRHAVIEAMVDERTKELRENQERLSKYVAAINDIGMGLFVVGRDYRVLDMNDTMIKWFGDQRGKICYKDVAGLDSPCPYCRLPNVIDSGETANYQPTTDDGRTFEIVAVPMNNSDGSVSKMEIIRDITERRQAEEKLQRSEERYRQISELSNDFSFSLQYNTDGSYTREWATDAMIRVTGYTSEEIDQLGGWHGLVHPDDQLLLKQIQKDVQAGKNRTDEYRIITKSGETRWIENTLYPTVDQIQNWVVRVYGTSRDITERKQGEAERERLMLAIEQSDETILITDPDGAIEYVNPAFERITGYTRAEAMGQNPRIIKSDEHDEAFYKEMWEVLTHGETWSGRIVNKKKDGTLFTEEATISPIRDASGKIINYVAVKRDVTNEIQIEEQLRMSQRMESVGLLAGGIAHDFNNLLQVIQGSGDLVLSEMPKESPWREDIEQVHRAAERAAELTRQLLAFSRRQVIQPVDLNLNQLVENLLKMIRRLIGENINLKFLPESEVGTICADSGQIEQVLMNLCINARDAMPQGGELTIETENIQINSEFVKTYTWANVGCYVLLTVTDTGCGITKEQIHHIFDPFFTTKQVGKGTGMGLAMVYGIVKQHEGYINVYSEFGQGTKFRIYLPLVERDAVVADRSIQTDILGGTETILVAEDEEMVLNLLARMLRRAGYTVLTAKDGREALRVFEEHADDIDGAIFDVVMPHMGGKDAMEQILKVRPDLPHLYASGYSEAVVLDHFVQKKDLQLIRKPYERETLLRKVREVLDAGS